MLKVRPISIHEANIFVERFHRHHGKKVGCKFAIAVYDDQLHGVAICVTFSLCYTVNRR